MEMIFAIDCHINRRNNTFIVQKGDSAPLCAIGRYNIDLQKNNYSITIQVPLFQLQMET